MVDGSFRDFHHVRNVLYFYFLFTFTYSFFSQAVKSFYIDLCCLFNPLTISVFISTVDVCVVISTVEVLSNQLSLSLLLIQLLIAIVYDWTGSNSGSCQRYCDWIICFYFQKMMCIKIAANYYIDIDYNRVSLGTWP